jgi:L-seryl-tRNA(Ser) seleniumtransferase
MAVNKIKTLRDFPSVEELVSSKELKSVANTCPRVLLTELVRNTISEQKKLLKRKSNALSRERLISAVREEFNRFSRQEIQEVMNATGILVHTNLGRAPLGENLIHKISKSISGYNNIEMDIASGKRGNRGEVAEILLAKLAGAEKATIVNNCAAALFIILNTFALKKKVILSRGELVQIGGGFRIPDILKRSGAKLTEVGTTNITKSKDYANAADNSTSMILKVHKSNFVQSGFTEETDLEKLVPIAKKHNLMLVHDIGSGALIPTIKLLGYDEPTPARSLKAGARLVCFSADKMLGGVQAGLIAGKRELIEKIKANPLFRTVRVDKITISALQEVFKAYLDSNYQNEIKLWKLLSVSESDLYRRAKKLCQKLGDPEGISVEATKAFIGGGGLPESALSSVGIVFSRKYQAMKLLNLFRSFNPPVIGRIENERLILDLKTISSNDEAILFDSIKFVLKHYQK